MLSVLSGHVDLEERLSQSAFARARWIVLVAADAGGRSAVSVVEDLASFPAVTTLWDSGKGRHVVRCARGFSSATIWLKKLHSVICAISNSRSKNSRSAKT